LALPAVGENRYDLNPPNAPEPGKPGRPADARGKAEKFIREALADENKQIGNDLAAEFEEAGGSVSTFWRAVEAMVKEGELTKGGTWKGQASRLAPNPGVLISVKTPEPLALGVLI
jgi:hypothetical protein